MDLKIENWSVSWGVVRGTTTPTGIIANRLIGRSAGTGTRRRKRYGIRAAEHEIKIDTSSSALHSTRPSLKDG